ncbi:MAG: hypothetical protein JEY99_04480 [Spirochaetales bacterium]|nr:hypothetical protein [Spirochaetales bacterium]
MKIFLILISIVNVFLLFLFGGGLLVGLSMGGNTEAAGNAVAVLVAASLVLFTIIPWLLHVISRNRKPRTAAFLKWIGVFLAILPSILAILLFLSLSATQDLPLKAITAIINK